MALLTDEQMMIRKMVHDLAENEFKPIAAELDEQEVFARQNVEKMKELGLLGVNISEEYGGGGADEISHLIVIEEVARCCASSSAILTTNALASGPLMLAGNEEQKKNFLYRIASGESLAAFAITEPGAGSDNAAMKSFAVKDGNDYIINGSKTFITNAGESGIITVVCKTDREAGYKGFSIFEVDADTPGLTIGKKEHKMGMHASDTREVIFEDMRVPAANMVGAENKGFYILMETFNFTRPGVGAQALGIAQGAYETALAYAQERMAFGKPIIKHQAVETILADMAIQIEAARHLVYHAGTLLELDGGHASPETIKVAAASKVFASDTAMRVTTDAVQVLGGYGYIREYPVERMMRDAKITQIWEGTNQILRGIIGKQIVK